MRMILAAVLTAAAALTSGCASADSQATPKTPQSLEAHSSEWDPGNYLKYTTALPPTVLPPPQFPDWDPGNYLKYTQSMPTVGFTPPTFDDWDPGNYLKYTQP